MKSNTKLHLVLFFILLISTNRLLAQKKDYTTYYNLINKAQRLDAENNTKMAIQEYDKAFLTAFPFPDDIIDAIKVNEKLNNKDKINKLLKLLVLSGYKKESEIPVYLEEDSTILKLVEKLIYQFPNIKKNWILFILYIEMNTSKILILQKTNICLFLNLLSF